MTRGKQRPDDGIRTDFLEVLSQVKSELARLARGLISDKMSSEDEWKCQLSNVLIPALFYGGAFYKLRQPVTQR